MSISGAWILNPKFIKNGFEYPEWREKFAWFPIWSDKHGKIIWLKKNSLFANDFLL